MTPKRALKGGFPAAEMAHDQPIANNNQYEQTKEMGRNDRLPHTSSAYTHHHHHLLHHPHHPLTHPPKKTRNTKRDLHTQEKLPAGQLLTQVFPSLLRHRSSTSSYLSAQIIIQGACNIYSSRLLFPKPRSTNLFTVTHTSAHKFIIIKYRQPTNLLAHPALRQKDLFETRKFLLEQLCTTDRFWHVL